MALLGRADDLRIMVVMTCIKLPYLGSKEILNIPAPGFSERIKEGMSALSSSYATSDSNLT